jgi:hypothetical protein
MDIRNVLEKLYNQNMFICPYTNEPIYSFLETPEGEVAVNKALKPFGRALCRVDGTGAFFIDAIDNGNNKDLSERRKQFEKIRDDLEPIVEFFVFISRVKPEIGMMSAGHTMRFSQVLNVVTESESSVRQLNQLMTFKIFKTSKQGTLEKLQVVFERMVKEGLLISKNADELVYQVTGKYDYVQAVMQFIIDRESIVIEEENNEEQGTFVI